MSDAAAPAKPTITATAVLVPADFQLTPPEVITPVVPEASKSAVPLNDATKIAVDAQVAKYVEALLTEDVESAAFKGKLDSAFALGREEISIASTLLQGRFMQQNFVGAESTPAYKAIGEIRAQLDELNPGKQGDLFQPNKLLGIIPWGNKLQAYFRKYQSAGTQLQTSMQQLYLARDDMQRDVVEIESTRGKLWEGMQKLAGAIHFSEKLDGQLAERVTALKATDPKRAHALEQEVLFYVRQNLQDMLTQQSVCINGYLALDVLKKTGREMVNGCSRVATTGMSALAVAQTVARATGNQLQVMEMLQGVNSTIEGLIAETGKQLNTHVEKTTEFSQNPGLGMEKLKEMFDQSFKAMDAMDTFRSKAIDVMGKNNVMLKDQIARSETYLDRVRQQQAREATGAPVSGPVKL
jgi:uncharacterized protein YaaN involved in tellurite resistance